MALSEEDFKKINDALEDSTSEVKNFYDSLADVFDLSKKITSQYSKTEDAIKKQYKELDASKQIVEQYRQEISKIDVEFENIGKQIEANSTKIYAVAMQELALIEEKKKKEQELDSINRNILKTMGTLARVSQDLAKNEDIRIELSNRSKKNEEEKMDLTKQLLNLEETRKTTGENTAHLDEMIADLKKRQATNALEGNKIVMKTIAAELKQGELLQEQTDLATRLNKQKTHQYITETKIKQLGEDIGRLAEERVGLETENFYLDEKQKKLNKDKADLSERISAEEEHQYQITKKISQLMAQLNFWKLIQMSYERFEQLDKAAENFRKTTGFTTTQMAELRKNVEAVNRDFAGLGVNIENAYKAAQALTDVFGRTSLVTKDAIENIALMSANLGVVETDAADALAIFQGMGGATQEVAMNTMMAGAALSEKTGVPFSKVMSDIAKSSGTAAMLLGTTPSKLMKAAIAARALGTDLEKLAAQQEKLLNYSDSINSELEASALLGRSISFQRARQLAYEGKVEESARATLDMVKQAGDFNEMSIYQRKALAAASGMELKDLTKMMAVEAQKNEIRMKGTPEQRKQLEMQEAELKKLRETNDLTKDNVLEENKKAIAQAKIQGIMTQINAMLDQMKTLIADIIEPIITPLAKVMIPLLKVVGMLIKGIAIGFKFVLEPIVWIAEGIGSMVDGAASFGKSIDFVKDKFKDFSTGVITLLQIAGAGIFAKIFFGSGGPSKLMSMVSTPFKYAKDAISGMMGKGAADPSKGLSDISKGAEKVPAKSGVKVFLSDLASGLKKMGDSKVLFGALNLIPASVGLIAMIPGAIGMAAIGVTGQLFAVGAKGLASGLSALAKPQVLLGTLALLGIGGAFALFGLGAKLVADAFVSISKVIPEAIGPLAELALLSPLLYIASGGIAALAISLGLLAAASIPATLASVAIYVVAKSVGKLGDGFQKTANGIAAFQKSAISIVNPIKQLATANLKDAATGIAALGDALMVFGTGSAIAGIGSLVGNFLGGDPIAKMERLANISEKLKESASAISEIAVATSKFSAVDSFAKSVGVLSDSLNKLTDSLGNIKTEELAKLSTIANASGAKTETAPVASTMSTEGIEAKLDKLADLLVGGSVRVYMDGKNVSAAMANTAGR